MRFPGTNSKPKPARGDRQRVGPSCRRHSHEAHAFVGGPRRAVGTAQSSAQDTEIIKCSGIQVGQVNCLLQIAILRGRRLRHAGKLCEGGRSGSVSACIRLFSCCRRGVHHVNRARRDFRYSLAERRYMDILGFVNINKSLQVKIETYRGTDPPPRNLEFRAKWKIGGFLIPQYDLCNLGRVSPIGGLLDACTTTSDHKCSAWWQDSAI